MPEDKETATEEPTAKKLSESHERGQFAQAPEFQVVAGLLAGYIVMVGLAPMAADSVVESSAAILGQMDRFEISPESIAQTTETGAGYILLLLLPLLVGTTLAGILAGGLQSGFKLTLKVMENGMEKLNPVSGFQRVFSKAGLVRMGVDTLKLFAVAAVIYWSLQEILGDPIFYTPVPPGRLGEFIYVTGMNLFLRLGLLMLVIALGHYLYQKQKTMKDLRMSMQEVKDENKQMMGDPLIKNAMRAMARRLTMKQMLSDIPLADVIVTNPTHFAVALRYERGQDLAPVVLAKGKNSFAKRIKAIGLEHGVPMVENRPVAQALFKIGEVGKSIPPQMYQAVAEILGFVYKTHRYYFHQLKARRLAEKATSEGRAA